METKWIGLSRSALGLGANRGPSLLGKVFEAEAVYLALWPPSEFWFDNIVGTIWLRRVYRMAADRVGHKIGEL